MHRRLHPATISRSSDLELITGRCRQKKARAVCGRLLWVLPLLASGCGQSSSERPQAHSGSDAAQAETKGGAAEGKVELQILDFDGIEQLVASHRGKVVVMDAWSTSCPPCLKEFPGLVALSKRYRPEELACISLSFDYEGIGTPDEQAPKVKQFLESQGATFDNVLSSDEADVLYRKFHLASIPAVFVYDKAGQLRKRFDNENVQNKADVFSYGQVGALVSDLMGEKPPKDTP
jgi:thiol-disulfide isomerase/thioredoxin